MDKQELAAMRQARDRDVYCRFPLCGCRRPGYVPRVFRGEETEVSHQKHRGMGGNPSGDRTVPALLVLICNWRHKLSKFSIDRGGIRWEALTEAGANGPIRWLLSAESLPQQDPFDSLTKFWQFVPDEGDEAGWFELAREAAPHIYAPFTDAQRAVLSWLAEMTD